MSDTLDRNQLGDRPSKGLDSALVQSMLGRVRQEIGGVQTRIEALQGELQGFETFKLPQRAGDGNGSQEG